MNEIFLILAIRSPTRDQYAKVGKRKEAGSAV